ncbi:MAG TPA: hypothetical protein VIO11_01900 [Candidatus Methanoperedens sp.]
MLHKILIPGQKFSYEYDCGSPTNIKLKVIHERKIEDSDRSIEILARNEMPLVYCDSCGKIATYICRLEQEKEPFNCSPRPTPGTVHSLREYVQWGAGGWRVCRPHRVRSCGTALGQDREGARI